MTLSVAFAINRSSNNQETRSNAQIIDQENLAIITPTAEIKEEPKIIELSRSEWKSKVNWEDACDSAYERSQGELDKGVLKHNLNNEKSLIEVFCSIGANSNSKVYFIYNESNQEANQVNFKQISPYTTDYTNLPDEKIIRGDVEILDNQIKIFNKYRAIGDCGDFSIYRFDGNNFVVEEIRVKKECDGMVGEANQWQEIY